MSLLELIARRSGSDPSGFSLPDVLAEQALSRLQGPDVSTPCRESEQINRIAAVQLANELLGETSQNAVRYAGQLVEHGIGERRLLGSVVAGAADVLGVAWEEDRLNFAQVTEAMGHLMDVARVVMGPPPRGILSRPNALRVLLVRTPGEDHVLGLRLVAQEMRRHGWLVRLDLSGEPAAMAAACTQQRFDIIGFTIAGARRIPALSRSIGAARKMLPDARVVIGGWLVQDDPDLGARLGADLALERNKLPVETLAHHFQLEAQ
ncbi:cobalamin B12-binding domain-containing protein [Oceanibium sediminis]|uniref:cobalamin B12-binding domain-containing protein n=1 Tax=Oceanibium sediminis TaxID=2026339 RepID=UPI000DD4299E|nr:cobalamin B12-binding domain-containing protein [Oceanibium sediminis]